MKYNRLKTMLFLILILFLEPSCSSFKPQIRTSPEGILPQTFSLYTTGPERPERWWEEFKDPELNALIEEALSGNFSLQEAWARLNQARALAVQAGSGLYPDLTGTAGASHGRQRTENGSRDTQTTKDYSLGLSSIYELDLWGRIRSEREAALLEVTATREDLNAAAMTVAAEVTDRWANIISQRMQKALLEKQLQTNRTYLELVELRFHNAMVSALDVHQQRQVVENVKAQIPLIEAQEQLLMHELALLLGKPPQTPIEINSDTLPSPVEIPATGLPADLLSSRPDVRAEGLRLYAADWQVAAARANRLPSISLTASASYGAGELGMIFNNWLVNLAANLTAPIFDGNQLAAEVDRTQAVADEQLSAYRSTVVTAVKEVEDALVSEEKQRQHIKALKSEIAAARKALDLARDRYLKGLDDYLPVLTQLLTVQELERDLIQRQTELLMYRVNLYRALGGTWTDELTANTGLHTAKTRGDMDNEG
jgi:multidrug efflux system outer membrane protein